jgi:hypothetical protein
MTEVYLAVLDAVEADMALIVGSTIAAITETVGVRTPKGVDRPWQLLRPTRSDDHSATGEVSPTIRLSSAITATA